MPIFALKYKTLLADLILILMVFVWGSTFFMIKGSLDQIDPVTMIVYRFGAAAAIMGGVLLVQKKALFSRFHLGFIVGVALWLIYVPQNIGMLYTSASNSGFITAFYVAFVPLLCLVFRIPLNPLRVMAAGLSLVGLMLLTGGIEGMNKGDLITLFAPLGQTFYIILCDKYLKDNVNPLTLCFQIFLTVSLLSLIWVLVFESSFAIGSVEVYWVLAYLTLVATVLTYGVSAYVQKISTPLKIALIFALEPVFTAYCAWQFGGEHLLPLQMLGGGLIVVALMISEMPAKRFLFWRFQRRKKQVS